jgi:hypothetical protein
MSNIIRIRFSEDAKDIGNDVATPDKEKVKNVIWNFIYTQNELNQKK